MTGRLAWLGAALTAVSLAGAGGAIGGGSGGSDAAPDSPSWREVYEQAEKRQRHRRAHRDSGAGRAERQRSRTAYRGQSDAEAHRTARTKFPALIGPWPARWRPLGEKDALRRYLSDNAAVVETAGDRTAVVESLVPLRGKQPDGHRAPVDLALAERGNALAPKSSATEVRLPKDADGALTFPGSSFAVRLAHAQHSVADLTYGKAFYANALEDTDLVLQAAPLGAEASLLLRSPESPTRPALDFDLARGQRLRVVSKAGIETGEAEIVVDDERVALIGPAVAVDAQGEGVEVRYEVRGSRLVLSVDTSRDVAYPVAVDPIIHEKNQYGQPLGPGPGANWAGWGLHTNNFRGACAGAAPSVFWACVWGDASIWIAAHQGQPYNAGDYAAWRNWARSGAYIFRFDTSNLSHNEMGWPGPYTVAFNGICNSACNAWMTGTWADPNRNTGGPWAAYDFGQTTAGQTRYYCVHGQAPPVGHCTGQGPENNAAALGGAAQFGLQFETGGVPGGTPYLAVGGAAVYKTDNSPPRVASVSHTSPVPPGWVTGYSDTATVTAVDNGTTGLGPNQHGMGMGSVTIAGAGTSQSRGTCGLSNNYDGCPWSWQAPGISYTAPEGKTTYTASARDIIENQSVSQDNLTWETKVDRTPPAMGLTGSIIDVNTVRDLPYVLNVDVSDGAGTGASAQSGVQSVTATLDGEVLRTVTPDCTSVPDSCRPDPFQVGFDGTHLAEGEHDVVVAATDRVGNTATRKVTFTVKHSATAAVGPGDVNLLSGTFTMTARDVSVPSFNSSLAVSRTYSSYKPDANIDPMFGHGWLSSLPVAEAAAEYAGIVESPAQTVAAVSYSDGLRVGFKALGDGSYRSPAGFKHIKLTKPGTNTFRLADSDGNVVTFGERVVQAGKIARYVPTQIDQPGSGNTTSVTYDVADGIARPTRLLAPVPSGVNCSGALGPGCRALSFVYATSTTASGGQWGDYERLVREVNFTAFDPATGQMRTSAVARYLYDQGGHLRAQWDPRISPALTTTYGYDADGHLTSITPPGQESWSLSYAATADDPTNSGRLRAVSRPALPGTATTTVAYGVPLTGAAAPYQMGPANVAAWAQSDAPDAATAIFPPNHVPSDPPSDYSPADVHYLDNQGRQVNLAEPGGRISTTAYDANDNVVRELTPASRQAALGSGESAQRAAELDTQRTFASDGIEMTDERGPLHTVELAPGETVQARRHLHVTYDEGRTDGAEHLPTTSTVSAQIAGRSDADARTTKTAYDWALGKPVTETKDPGGLNITETTLYDGTTGLVRETRQPANPSGGDAHATKTIYWSAGANSADAACGGKPEWASLPCKTTPAAQPGGSLPPIQVTRNTYNWLGQVATQTDTSGTTTRTQTFIYDGAGRQVSEAITSGAGAPQPTVFTAYHPTLGLPTATSTSDGTITRGYDTLGRIVSYGDANGNTSTTTYDLLARPATTSDGKGSQIRTYDSTTGDLTGLWTSGVGSVSAEYDADGKLIREVYPNSIQAQTAYDETGEPTGLVYSKWSNCGADCTWYSDRVTASIHGQWLSETSTLGDKDYAYDAAGRLKQVRDTPDGLGCTVRDYSYDANSNRTARVRHDPAVGGACDPGSAGTRSDYQYDSADRLVAAGYTYDAFGRTSTVPGRDAGGATGGTAAGNMTQTYFADNRVESITQNAITASYTLDPNLRTRTESVTGTQPDTRTNHYSDDSDSPAWTSEDATGTHWSRNITGIDGDLIAIQDSVTGVQFQLSNLHGDLIATAAASSSSPSLVKTSRYDEFGVPATGNTPDRYGWLGSKRRATSQPSGAMLMGQRVYVPTTGRFLQTDPVEGGSANTYDYANADPVNSVDLDGRAAARTSRAVLGVCPGAFLNRATSLDPPLVLFGAWVGCPRGIHVAGQARLYRSSRGRRYGRVIAQTPFVRANGFFRVEKFKSDFRRSRYKVMLVVTFRLPENAAILRAPKGCRLQGRNVARCRIWSNEFR